MTGSSGLAGDRADASVRLAFCWAHMRRHFYEFYDSIEITASRRGCARTHPRALRDRNRRSGVIPLNTEGRCGRSRSRPIVEALHAWLQDHLGRVSAISDLAKAMRWHTLRALVSAWWCSSMTAASRWTPTWSKEPIRPTYTHAQERIVRRLGRRCPSLVDRHVADPYGEAEWRRSDGMAHRCPLGQSCRAAQNPTN